MDKTLKNTIVTGIVIVTLSFVFYSIFLPLKKEYMLKQCFKKSFVQDRDPFVKNEKNVLYEDLYNKCLGENGLQINNF